VNTPTSLVPEAGAGKRRKSPRRPAEGLDRFPEWLLAVDRALPFYGMAEVIRAGLSSGLVTDLTRSYLILLAWTAGRG
jgi:hypothetical protein